MLALPHHGSKPQAQLKTAHAETAGLKNEVKLLRDQVEALVATVKERDKEIRSLKQEKAVLLRRNYGPKSDRPGSEAQMLLDEMFAEATVEGGEDEGEGELAKTTRRRRRSTIHRPANL